MTKAQQTIVLTIESLQREEMIAGEISRRNKPGRHVRRIADALMKRIDLTSEKDKCYIWEGGSRDDDVLYQCRIKRAANVSLFTLRIRKIPVRLLNDISSSEESEQHVDVGYAPVL